MDFINIFGNCNNVLSCYMWILWRGIWKGLEEQEQDLFPIKNKFKWQAEAGWAADKSGLNWSGLIYGLVAV